MGTQNTIVATNLPSFPWNQGDPLDAIPLNNAFIQMQQQINNMANQITLLQESTTESNLGVSITTSWGGNTMVTAGPYTMTGSAPYEFTVINVDYFVGTNGGDFTATLTDNGVPIPGLSDIFVNGPTVINVLAPIKTIINQGDVLGLLISQVDGTPQNAWITVNGTTNVVPIQVQGITAGFASGVATVTGIGTLVLLDQALGAALGLNAAIAIGMGVTDAVGIANGAASGSAQGVHVTIGSSAFFATGTSAAAAVGASTTITPTLVLDDPSFGVLDVNPLA